MTAAAGSCEPGGAAVTARRLTKSKCWANGPHDRPARYRWTFALSGNVVYLCEECCAVFRANAAADPSLGASRITQISGEEAAELVQAIPPAYTEHIGRQLLGVLAASEVAP